MRTTVTLDPDVDQLIKEEMRRSGTTFRQAVNQAGRFSSRNLIRVYPAQHKSKNFLQPAVVGLLGYRHTVTQERDPTITPHRSSGGVTFRNVQTPGGLMPF